MLAAGAAGAADTGNPPAAILDGAPAGGATTAVPARPRIALALSGGGARGAAHIGVLKVLESLRVPIDCIAGTSMGAIVGGVYAAGTSATAMAHIIDAADWRAIFDDAPPRAEVAVRRKADDYRGLADPEIGIGPDGLRMPRGVIAGVSLESFLRRLTQSALDVSDFSRLPIPFRAVASDIVTGEQVVIDHGNLSRAMRASMAIPGAMAPVELDGRLLVDGGITNNLPIDVARASCDADVIIAVNIQTPMLRRDEITSAIGVVGQLLNLLGKSTVDRQLDGLTARDILISPDLGDLSALHFDRTPEAVRIGEAAAMALADRLARHSLPAAEYAEWRIHQIVPPVGLGRVDRIGFEGLSLTNHHVLGGLLQTRPGDLLAEEDIGRDLRRVYGRGDFESVDYRIASVDGVRTLLFGVREKRSGPGYLRLGIGAATDFHGESQFNLRASYRRAWLNAWGAEWTLDAQVGQRNALLTEFYQPLRPDGGLFVAPWAVVDESRRNLYVGDARVSVMRGIESRAGVDVGAVLGTAAEWRVGLLARRFQSSTDIGVPVLPDDNESAGGLRTRLFVDQMDRPYFARDGHAIWLDATAWRRVMHSERGSYQRVDARADWASSLGANTLNLSLQGGSRVGSVLPAFDTFSLGGPFALSGHAVGQYLVDGFAFARLQYYRRLQSLPAPLGTGLYAGASAEFAGMAGVLGSTESTFNRASGALFVGADTFVGPVHLIAGFAPSGHRTLYLFIGLR